MRNILKTISSILIIPYFFTVAAFAAENVTFYHTDPAGTPIAMTDASGNVLWKADYKPFGEEQTITGTIENNKRFAGKEKDEETGLYYFGARYMRPEIGRFITVDPVGPVDPRTSKTDEKVLHNPQLLNRYSYSANNPYRYIDPDGRNVWDIIDFGVFGYDIYRFIKKPSWSGLGDIGADALGLLPGVPTVGSIKIVGKWLGKVEEAVEGGKAGKLLWGTWNDYPKVIIGGQEYARIGERLYTRHAVERMMPVGLSGRGIPPAVVENAIQFGIKTEGKFGRIIYTFENVRVITEKDIVISVIKIGK